MKKGGIKHTFAALIFPYIVFSDTDVVWGYFLPMRSVFNRVRGQCLILVRQLVWRDLAEFKRNVLDI
ncbi:TPA: hypothetical protein DDW35_06445 [Candidatus Sumerlaeota bacterium]|nr:hypothetical protein [Candidatus Sumerlaeota bacterium]